MGYRPSLQLTRSLKQGGLRLHTLLGNYEQNRLSNCTSCCGITRIIACKVDHKIVGMSKSFPTIIIGANCWGILHRMMCICTSSKHELAPGRT